MGTTPDFPPRRAAGALQAVRRTGDFALSRPVRDVRCVTLAREERYAPKNVVDTVALRFGDPPGAFTCAVPAMLPLRRGDTAAAAVPPSVAWLRARARHASAMPVPVAAIVPVNPGARPS